MAQFMAQHEDFTFYPAKIKQKCKDFDPPASTKGYSCPVPGSPRKSQKVHKISMQPGLGGPPLSVLPLDIRNFMSNFGICQ